MNDAQHEELHAIIDEMVRKRREIPFELMGRYGEDGALAIAPALSAAGLDLLATDAHTWRPVPTSLRTTR